MLRWLMQFAIGIAFILSTTVQAHEPGIGVVLLHGHGDSPQGYITSLADQLDIAGILVKAPEMPWSTRRVCDQGIDAALEEIDQAVADLRARGAERIYLVGHSMGAAMAVRYASHAHVDGLIAIAPGNYPESALIRPHYAASVARARMLIAAGHGSSAATFDEWRPSGSHPVTCPADVWRDFHDPKGPMNFHHLARMMPAGIPILWILARQDNPDNLMNGQAVFDLLPHHPVPTLAQVDATHGGAPDAAADRVVNWLTQQRQAIAQAEKTRRSAR